MLAVFEQVRQDLVAAGFVQRIEIETADVFGADVTLGDLPSAAPPGN
jgi:hypothetical protein